MATVQSERDRLARLIDNTFFAHYDGDRLGQACLYWAHYAVEVLTVLGIRAIIQAGSASWPRLRPDQDDGVSPTHHSYVWEPRSTTTKSASLPAPCPSCTSGPPSSARGEIIDMTTRYWPEQCRLILGLDWPGDQPPTYFWAHADELPDRVLYVPDIKAIALALHLLKGDLP